MRYDTMKQLYTYDNNTINKTEEHRNGGLERRYGLDEVLLLRVERPHPHSPQHNNNDIKKRGRPPKNNGELESESITIKITPSELEALKIKTDDLIPTSTLIKHYLRTKTDIFKK